MIKNLTKEQIEELVKSMVSPKRCGGLGYIDGQAVYKFGTHLVPEAIVSGERKIFDDWFDTHDHKECVLLRDKIPLRVSPIDRKLSLSEVEQQAQQLAEKLGKSTFQEVLETYTNGEYNGRIEEMRIQQLKHLLNKKEK